MDEQTLSAIIERYFNVVKKAEALIKTEISEELTKDQHAVLRFIKANGQCTSSQLAKAFFVKKSAITAIVNRLAEKNIIARQRDANDRRVVYLTLTDYGEKLYQHCSENIRTLAASLTSYFKQDEVKAFLNIYEKLDQILDQKINDALKGVKNEVHT
ncbi:DNA-binding MarR family transcriptional regulator [Scopulibacillus daqui]|uniref:DNA-binding MarR family transcriptional regulator n=1 Tax=Scopulibacillus daqui TaxID=1469162 RepID=A0ABS2Q1W4_9BACL|nr:MarR family transcriptional regulator [Scopulibacillus daqui]MBM7645709.1 DNA-binding MarR family transcriptional regulator [Scopulibacillus daqui]